MKECEYLCHHHCSHDIRFPILVGHAESCPRATAKTVHRCALELLSELLEGIDSWASDEDGVPDQLFKAYAKAKMCVGDFDVEIPEFPGESGRACI